MSDWIHAFAPATVANVGPGLDVFGFAVESPGDVVAARRRDDRGVVIAEITGDRGRLPREAARNSASVAAARLLALTGREDDGVELRVEKGMPLRSGLGSSAASSVAAVVAVDALLTLGAPRDTLLEAALEGERIACGSPHADNAAPSLVGGFVLVRERDPRVIELPVPEGLACAVVRPHAEVDTGAARRLLGDRIALAAAVGQWGNTAALVAGLFYGDLEILQSALHDAVAEPLRSSLVPGFAVMKEAALERDEVLGCSLSGSGPSVFVLTASRVAAHRAADRMVEALAVTEALDADVFISDIGASGARVLDEGEDEGEVPCAS